VVLSPAVHFPRDPLSLVFLHNFPFCRHVYHHALAVPAVVLPLSLVTVSVDVCVLQINEQGSTIRRRFRV